MEIVVSEKQQRHDKILLRLDSIDNRLEQMSADLTGLFTTPLLSVDVVGRGGMTHSLEEEDGDGDNDTMMRQGVRGATPFCSCSLGDWISLTLCK